MYNLPNNNFGRYNPSFNAYNQPYYNNMQYVQPPLQQTEEPMPILKFMRNQEIPGHAVNAGTTEILVDRENHQFTVKSANMIGESYSKAYKYAPLDEMVEKEDASKKSEKQPEFVKKEELESYATKDDIKNLMTLVDGLKAQLNKKPEGDFLNGNKQ